MPSLVRGSPQSHYRMLAAKVQCRDMMRTEEDDRLRTIDCLRGRLQAERATSKVAKEEAWHLAKRLEELEKKLAEEIKFRSRAERRLQYAVKKLRSLDLLDDRSAVDFPASSTSSSSSRCFMGREGAEGRGCPPAEGSGQCGLPEAAEGAAVSAGSDCLSDASSATLSHQFASVDDGSWSSEGTAQSHFKGETCPIKSDVELPDDSLRVSSDYDDKQEIQEPDSEENMLALVPFSHQPKPEPAKAQTRENVQDVLLALRTVKQQLLYSLQQRANVSAQKELLATQASSHNSSTTWHRSY